MSIPTQGGLLILLLPAFAAVAWGGGDTPSHGARDAHGKARVETTKRGPRMSDPRFSLVTDAMLRRNAGGENWLTYAGAYNGQHHSTLDQINTANVAQLAPAWIYQTGIARSFENTPVVANGVMYITAPETNEIIALDAATGEQIWRFDPKIGQTTLCCGPNNRGVAVYQDKVYEGTLDGRLVAVDAQSGQEVWERQVGRASDGYSITAAPLAFDGKVVTGTGGGEYGIRGRLVAYDAATGKHLWTFYTIPSPDEAPNGWWGEWKTHTPFGLDLHRDIAKEKADSAKYADEWKRGGGATWMTPAYDPDTQTLYIAVGNPSPDLDGSVRPGDNLYTQSIVAVDANTGKHKWHFQYIPHGVWDLDATSPPTIFTLNGRKVVGEAGKIGFYYVLDAATGAPILRSENFVPMDSLFTDPTRAGVHMLPGANGGSEWSPTAYSPETGWVYVLGLHQPMTYSTHSADYPGGDKLWLGSAFTGIQGKKQWGVFSAIDPSTGDVKWSREVPDPMQGGAVTTSGGLVFVGQGNGWFDAFDARTGERLWHFNTGAGVNAAPMTYSVDGVQYVAVAAGGIFQIDTQRGDNLIAFALPDRRATSMSSMDDGGGDGYASPPMADFKRVQPLRYDAVERGTEKAPAEIVTGALERTGGPTAAGDPPADPPADPKPALAKYMSVQPSSHAVTYTIDAATDAANHGWNFDGYANGDMKIVVPEGWKVTFEFKNLDPSVPHSAGIVDASPGNIPAQGSAAKLAFPGARTTQFSDGLGNGRSDRFTFTADKAGSYLLICGVPGHGESGMWDRFDVSKTATKPSISATGG